MRVSVLMTSFEHERFIARALDGVLDQRGVELELLVGDDASTDGTRDVIAEYAPSTPGRHPHLPAGSKSGRGRQGDLRGADRDGARRIPGRARRRRLLDEPRQAAAPGGLPRRASRVLDVLSQRAVCLRGRIAGRRAVQRARPAGGGRHRARCWNAAWWPRARRLFRRESISPLPSWYFELPWGDWPLYFIAAEHGALRYLPDVMGVYRIHGGGMYSRLSRLEALEARTDFYRACACRPSTRASGGGSWRRAGSSGLWSTTDWCSVPPRCVALGTAVRVSPGLLLSAPGAVLSRRRGRAETSRRALGGDARLRGRAARTRPGGRPAAG